MQTYTTLFGHLPLIWQDTLLQGDDQPPPGMENSNDAGKMWLHTEERLGRGARSRQIKLYLRPPFLYEGKALFQPPSWWNILHHEEQVQTYSDDGEEKGPIIPVTPKPRKDGAVAIQTGRIAVLTVQIELALAFDTLQEQIRAAVIYAVVWSNRRDEKLFEQKEAFRLKRSNLF
jgi:hypothetical protein